MWCGVVYFENEKVLVLAERKLGKHVENGCGEKDTREWMENGC